jgi:hypothetical protein
MFRHTKDDLNVFVLGAIILSGIITTVNTGMF